MSRLTMEDGVIKQSAAAPYTAIRYANLHSVKNSAGVRMPFDINTLGDTQRPTVYARLDDGGAFTNYDTAADNATANDVNLLPAAEGIDDAFYFGSDTKFAFVKIKIGTSGVGTAIAWEYYNGSAWVALTVTDNTLGFTAAPGIYDISFTPPTNWASTTVNAQAGWWIRARCTAASFTTQPKADRIWMGGQDQFELIFDVLADGTETKLVIGTQKGTGNATWDIYINGVLDSSGYDDYNASSADVTRIITLTQPIKKGWNEIILKVNGKNASSTAYSSNCYGLAVF